MCDSMLMMFVHLNRWLLKFGHNADLICSIIKTKVPVKSKVGANLLHAFGILIA
jgi:hypothetical protein